MKTSIRSILFGGLVALSSMSALANNPVKDAISDALKLLLENPTVASDGVSYIFHPTAAHVCQLIGDPNSSCTSQFQDVKISLVNYEDLSVKYTIIWDNVQPAIIRVSPTGEISLDVKLAAVKIKIAQIAARINASGGEAPANLSSYFPTRGEILISLAKESGTNSLEAKLKVLDGFSVSKTTNGNSDRLIYELATGTEISLRSDRNLLANIASLDLKGLHLRLPASMNQPDNIPLELTGTEIAAAFGVSDDSKKIELSNVFFKAIGLKVNDNLVATLDSNNTHGGIKFTQTLDVNKNMQGARIDLADALSLKLTLDTSSFSTDVPPSGVYEFKSGANTFARFLNQDFYPTNMSPNLPNPIFGNDGNGNWYYYGKDSNGDIVSKSLTPQSTLIDVALNGVEVSAPIAGGVHGLIQNLSAQIVGNNTTDLGPALDGKLNINTGYFDIGGRHLASWSQNQEVEVQVGGGYSNNALYQQVYVKNAFDIQVTAQDDLYRNLFSGLPAGFGLIDLSAGAGTLIRVGDSMNIDTGNFALTNNGASLLGP